MDITFHPNKYKFILDLIDFLSFHFFPFYLYIFANSIFHPTFQHDCIQAKMNQIVDFPYFCWLFRSKNVLLTTKTVFKKEQKKNTQEQNQKMTRKKLRL